MANGNHTISVYAHFLNSTDSRIINEKILVNTTYTPPTPIMISPKNQTTYNTRQVPLIYTINSKVFFSNYALDTTAPVYKSFTHNTTLTDLSEGEHKIELVVVTEYYISNQIIYFNIDTTKITSTPSLDTTLNPTTNGPTPLFSQTIIAVTVSLVIVVIVSVICIKKFHKISR